MTIILRLIFTLVLAILTWLATLPFNILGFAWAVIYHGFARGFMNFTRFVDYMEKKLNNESIATMQADEANAKNMLKDSKFQEKLKEAWRKKDEELEAIIVRIGNNSNNIFFMGTRKQFAETHFHSQPSTNEQIIQWAKGITENNPDLQVWVGNERIA